MYLFAPEIADTQRGKFNKTIALTIVSTLSATYQDIQYFVTTYPLRAIAILSIGLPVSFGYLKHSNTLQKIRIKKKFKQSKLIIIITYHKVLNWIYFSKPVDYIEAVEKKTFSFVWSNFRILILSVLIFGHVPLKFSATTFGIIFLISWAIYGLLFLGKVINKYPVRVYAGTILYPWIILFPFYFVCKYSGTKPFFLEEKSFAWFLAPDTSNWLISIIKFCIFSSLSFLCILILGTVLSITVRFIFKISIQFLKLGLIQLPVFSRQKKKAQQRFERKI